LNPVQAVQAALTLCFARPGRQPRIDSLVRAFPGHVHHELRSFLTTLLARRIGARPSATERDLKAALEAAWCEPLVIRRWQRVALRMDAATCETVAQALPAAASGVLSLRYLSFDQATEGWALETRGMAAQAGLDWDHSPVTPVTPATQQPSAAVSVRPRISPPVPTPGSLFERVTCNHLRPIPNWSAP